MLVDKKIVKRYVNFVCGFHKKYMTFTPYPRSFSAFLAYTKNRSLDYDICSALIGDEGYTLIIHSEERKDNVEFFIPYSFVKDPDTWEKDYMIEKLSEAAGIKKMGIDFQEGELKRMKLQIEDEKKKYEEYTKLVDYLKNK